MTSNRITVIKGEDELRVTSNHIAIKQAIGGWGSWGTGSGKREYPEFYGRETRSSDGHDAAEWEWTLGEESARHLIAFMKADLLESDLQSDLGNEWLRPHEKKANRDVIRALDNALSGTAEPVLDTFTEAYIQAALWITNDESDPSGGEPLDTNYGPGDIAPEALAKIRNDCARFQTENAEALAAAYALYRPRDGFTGPALAGHDFWLTRCGCGAGFWDRGLDEVGDRLVEASKAFGECWITVGDDEKLYGF